MDSVIAPQPESFNRTLRQPGYAEAMAQALREAARDLDRIGDGELDPHLTSNWLRKRADRLERST